MNINEILDRLKDGQTIARADIGDKETADKAARILEQYILDMKKVVKQLKQF